MVAAKVLQQRYREPGAEEFYVPNRGVLWGWRVHNKILDWGLDPGKYVLILGRFSPEKGGHLLGESPLNISPRM